MTKLERLQIKNGTKSAEKSDRSGYIAPKQPKVLHTLQVYIKSKGWVDVTAPATMTVISGVKRRLNFKYRTV